MYHDFCSGVPLMDFVTWFFSASVQEASGWGLFVSLALFIVIGAFREWWVPGGRARRSEEARDKAVDALNAALDQNGDLIRTNKITEHFFLTFAPVKQNGPGNDAVGVTRSNQDGG